MDNRIGAQLYTVRDYTKTAEDLENTFAKLKEIGYKTVQLSGIGDIPAEKIRELLEKYELEPICTHRNCDEYLEKLDFIIDFHKIIGCKIAGLGYLPNDYRTTEGIEEFIKKFSVVSKKLAENGISFAYHNHAFEFVKYNGKYLMDIILEKTDFNLILDVYWLTYAGINPAKFICKVGKRAQVIHFKDLAINNEGKVIMTEVMEGNIEWDEVISACEEAGCLAAMVEQDTCKGDPFESMKISYNNLLAKGFM